MFLTLLESVFFSVMFLFKMESRLHRRVHIKNIISFEPWVLLVQMAVNEIICAYMFSQCTHLIIQLIKNTLFIQCKLHTYSSGFSKKLILNFKLIWDFFSSVTKKFSVLQTKDFIQADDIFQIRSSILSSSATFRSEAGDYFYKSAVKGNPESSP